jgi:two-component system, LytTR family, sensor kinase
MAALFLAIVALVNGILALVMRGFITWYGDIRLKEELNRRNVEMELALIKSQLSPHFLFNTLNNIDVLIGKDADRASDYLKKLSDMLRFMLYETKTAQIPIARELGYIEKYIELQRIRTSNPDAIDYIVEGQPGGLMVEPMLFIPFIENAFKHGQWRENHSIRVRFVLGAEKIVFNCENTYGSHDGAAVRGGVLDSPAGLGGLGNALIRKRLLLLYPDRHTLNINAGNQLYQATLTLAAHAN